MSVQIQVNYSTLAQSELLKIAVPNSIANPKTPLQRYRLCTLILCELKREIYLSKNIPPLYQQLTFDHSPENVALYLTSSSNEIKQVFCIERKQRMERESVIIESWNGKSYEIFMDGTADTIIDLKFKFASMIDSCPEYIQFLIDFKYRSLQNLQTLSSSKIMSNNPRIFYWLEIPCICSQSETNNFVVRSGPRLLSIENPKFSSIGSMFRCKAKEFANNPFLGTRTFTKLANENGNKRGSYEWMTYGQANEMVSDIASAFIGLLHLQPHTTKMGICAMNRREWMLCEYAGHMQSFISVPLYDTLAKNAIEYIVNHAEIELLICDINTVEAVAKVKDKCQSLKYIILMDLESNDREWIEMQKRKRNGKMYSYLLSELIAYGQSLAKPIADCFPKDSEQLATICYTSGTTGNPKGVMLTHTGLILTCLAVENGVKDFDSNGVLLSYLPLAHVYEKMLELLIAIKGARCAYWSGDILTLLDDIQASQPTFFAGVPRVYQKLHDRILAGVETSNALKKCLFWRAYHAKEESMKNKSEPSAIWDKLVFSKIRERFGGKITACVSGSAPLSSSTANFLKLCFSDTVIEGYGLTETSAAGSGTHEDDDQVAHVGQIAECIEMKLMDVPDMNYTVDDEPHPRGEIWLRGPTVFKGYFRDKEKTAAVLNEDGWFSTGDIGMWRMDGRLQIIDRKKNIFKLAQGEYIRPEYIENVYKLSPFVANIFVNGNSSETYLVGIVVPDFEVLRPYARNTLGIANDIVLDSAKLIRESSVMQVIRREMDRIAVREELLGFEKVLRMTLIVDDFSIENGILTATMKLKRNVARSVFEKDIERMYAQVATSKL